MNTLYEYLTNKNTIVSKHDLNHAPLSLGGKLEDIIKDFAEGDAKSYIVNAVKEWYEKNQRRRNIKVNTVIDCSFFANDSENKVLNSVISELRRIGVTGYSGEFESFDPKYVYSSGLSFNTSTIKFSVGTYKQMEEGTYTYEVGLSGYYFDFKKVTYGNGYNDLKADDINILRQKLYDCMIDTSYEIIAIPIHNTGGLMIPRFKVVLKAVYDNAKLKKFLTELKEDRRLQNYADRMDAMDKGISAYYASKRPGEYVGD